jgi:hypothetical protein
MKNYAVIQNDTVFNVIVAKNLSDAKLASNSECVECDGSFWIGWTRVDGEWVAPQKPIEEQVTE